MYIQIFTQIKVGKLCGEFILESFKITYHTSERRMFIREHAKWRF